MRLKNNVYDVLKWVAIVVLPALAVLYSKLAGAWGWPYAAEIADTIAAVQLFLGAIIGVSTATYYSDKAKAAPTEETYTPDLDTIIYDAKYEADYEHKQ